MTYSFTMERLQAVNNDPSKNNLCQINYYAWFVLQIMVETCFHSLNFKVSRNKQVIQYQNLCSTIFFYLWRKSIGETYISITILLFLIYNPNDSPTVSPIVTKLQIKLKEEKKIACHKCTMHIYESVLYFPSFKCTVTFERYA